MPIHFVCVFDGILVWEHTTEERTDPQPWSYLYVSGDVDFKSGS